jgi:hypothetical protein
MLREVPFVVRSNYLHRFCGDESTPSTQRVTENTKTRYQRKPSTLPHLSPTRAGDFRSASLAPGPSTAVLGAIIFVIVYAVNSLGNPAHDASHHRIAQAFDV